jgi:glucokinase
MVARAVAAPLVIGVDVGGTKILSGVVDREGNVLSRNLLESPGTHEQDVLAALDASVDALLDDRIGAIGFGIPSNLDRRTGKVLRATNLPLDDFDLRGHARARFGLPVGVENDGNAAALAEWKLGAGKGLDNIVMLTLGTGVGGGIVVEGRLYRGWAELGHIGVQADGPPCQGNCHGRGHLEALVSGSAADRIAAELWGPGATSHTLVERAREGSEEALASLDEMAMYLGAGIGSLVNTFDPELVIVGGGFGKAAADFLLAPAQEAARRQSLSPADRTLRVVPSALEDAGLVGAGLVGFEALDGAW